MNLQSASCNQVPRVQAVNADLHVGVYCLQQPKVFNAKSPNIVKKKIFYINVKIEEL